MKSKGQATLEALAILGILLIGVIIFGVYYFQATAPKHTENLDLRTDQIFKDKINTNQDFIDPNTPLPCNNNGVCDPGENNSNCPNDCYCGNDVCDLGEDCYTCEADCGSCNPIGSFSDFNLVLDPVGPSVINSDFNIIADINSNNSYANIILVEITKYDDLSSNWKSTNNCEFNGDYNSIFTNIGQLLPSGTDILSNTFTFSCNTPGNYNFKFTVSNQDNTESITRGVLDFYYPSGKEIIMSGICEEPLGTPQFSPAGGTFSSQVSVSLSYTDPSCLDYNIHYTLDGTEPTKTSTIYSTEIHLQSTTTIKAKVFAKNTSGQDINGDTNSQEYIIIDCIHQFGIINFYPDGGYYGARSSNQWEGIYFNRIIITQFSYVPQGICPTETNRIYYTLDGNNPTADSNYISFKYPGYNQLPIENKITLKNTTTVKARIIKEDDDGNKLFGPILSKTYYLCTSAPGANTTVDTNGLFEGTNIISTAQELASIKYPYFYCNYTLGQDIDLNIPPYNQGTGWIPIGVTNIKYYSFSGTFDGNNFKIKNLYINNIDNKPKGLFSRIIEGARIKNLILEDINIISKAPTGGIAGEYIRCNGSNVCGGSGSIENCRVSGRIKNTGYNVGGILGSLDGCVVGGNCPVSNSSFSGNIDGNRIVGGIIGQYYNIRSGSPGYLPFIFNCKVDGNISGIGHVGGIMGLGAGLSNNSFNGRVTGFFNVGGIIGYYIAGAAQYVYPIKYNFSNGIIIGDVNVGGLIGLYTDEGYLSESRKSIFDNYSFANVVRKPGSTDTHFGGLIGGISKDKKRVNYNYSIGQVIYQSGTNPTNKGFSGTDILGRTTNNFWDINASGQLTSPLGATGKTTTEMKDPNTFADWNSSIWAIDPTINDGYPYLINNPPQ